MTKSISDELGAILEILVNTVGVAPHLLYHSDEEKEQMIADAIPNAIRQIEDFYRNKIPEKRKGLPSYDGWSMSAINGYNQAIDEITAQFNSKGGNDE